MHKKAPGLVARALHSVTTYGFTIAAIDAPGHGDRPRNLQDQQWAEAIHQARAAGEPIAPIVIDHNMSLAERTCARVVTSAAHKGLLGTGNPSLRSGDRPRARATRRHRHRAGSRPGRDARRRIAARILMP